MIDRRVWQTIIGLLVGGSIGVLGIMLRENYPPIYLYLGLVVDILGTIAGILRIWGVIDRSGHRR